MPCTKYPHSSKGALAAPVPGKCAIADLMEKDMELQAGDSQGHATQGLRPPPQALTAKRILRAMERSLLPQHPAPLSPPACLHSFALLHPHSHQRARHYIRRARFTGGETEAQSRGTGPGFLSKTAWVQGPALPFTGS